MRVNPRQLIAAASITLGSLGVSAAPIPFDGTAAYSQNFQSMTTAANATPVTGSTMTEISTLTGGNSSVSGWYIYGLGWTTGVTTKWLSNDAGGSTSGGFRQLLDTQSTVGRALGSQGSGTAQGWFGLVLKNTSSATIDNLALSYDAVMNRNPSTTVNAFPLTYLVSSTAVSTATTAGAAGTFSATMTSSTLGFSTPSTGTGAPGTPAAINPLFKIATMSGTLSSLGWGAGQYLYMAWKETDEGGNDAGAGVDNFSLSVPAAVRNLLWNTGGGGSWDSSTANWFLSGSSTTFAATDIVTFAGTGGTITLSGALAPTSVNVTNSSGTYTFTGATSGDKITGTASLTKTGLGELALTSDNDYSGGTNINGGTLTVDGGARLGSGVASLNGGTLAFTSNFNLTNALSVGSNGGTLSTALDRSASGALTLGGLLTKQGAGALTLTGAVLSSAGGGFNVAAGDLIIGQASGVVKLFGNTSLTGNLVAASGIRLDVDGGSTVSGSGLLKVVSTGTLISNTSGDTGGTITAGIFLNSGNAAFTPGSWVGSSYSAGTFLTTIGGTKGINNSTLSGVSVSVVSGNSDVDFSNNSTTGGGGGQLVLAGVSTYTGMTTINTGTVDVAYTANILLQISNPLPVATGLIVGTKASFASGQIDLNGYNLRVAYLADGSSATAAKVLTITNQSSSTDSVLTLGGSLQAGTGFSGRIDDGSFHKVAVVKIGTNTQLLTNDGNLYTGGTTLTGGELQVAASGVLGTGQVTFNGGSLSAANATPVTLANNLAATGNINLGNATNNGEITLTGTLNLGGSGRTITLASDATLSGVISAGGLTKAGPGRLTLSGTNSYAGGTTVSAGKLVVGSAGALGAGAVTVDSSGTLSLGLSSSAITAASLALTGGAILEFAVLDASGVRGTSYSSLATTGVLNLSAASLSTPVIIKMMSNSTPGVLGAPSGFSSQGFYSFSLITAGSLNLGSNAKIADVLFLNLTDFTYSDGTSSSANHWAFSYDTVNNSVMLTSVPEPSTYGLGLGILALAVVSLRKRRKLV